MLVVAGCVQLDGDPGDLDASSADLRLPAAADQACVGEIVMGPAFTPTTVTAQATFTCSRGGKLKFKMCIRRRLMQSAGTRVWNYFFHPADHIANTLATLVGVDDCVETPDLQYEDPPPGTTFTRALGVDVFCGDLGATYSYQPILKSVESFWPNVFMTDNWHNLAMGSPVTHTCGR